MDGRRIGEANQECRERPEPGRLGNLFGKDFHETVGEAAASYVTGAVLGALVFGYLTDRLGRKRMFLETLALYLASTVATAFAGGALSFFVCRFFTGAAIGGEYSAINSAIDELIPARVRGWVDLAINGSFWLGAIAGAALSLVLLDLRWFSAGVGWRVAFALGAALAVAILIVRRHVPESPRWLFLHGRLTEAEFLVSNIESRITQETGALIDVTEFISVRTRTNTGLDSVVKTLIATYPKRTILGLALRCSKRIGYSLSDCRGLLSGRRSHVYCGGG
jgi:MFS family permease